MTKVLSMCLVHDLPEVKVGDLTPHDEVSNKAELEHSAMNEIAPYWLPHLKSMRLEKARRLDSLNKSINLTWGCRQ